MKVILVGLCGGGGGGEGCSAIIASFPLNDSSASCKRFSVLQFRLWLAAGKRRQFIPYLQFNERELIEYIIHNTLNSEMTTVVETFIVLNDVKQKREFLTSNKDWYETSSQ